MVAFFNKKEEMLEVQLTEYGKYLLSLGQLQPAYYSFFDDEILYNSEYVQTGSTANYIIEDQNDIDRRIRYETPNLKVMPSRTGAETRVARFLDSVSGMLGASNSDPADSLEAFQQQAFIEKINFSSYPIGTAKMSSDKTAAWSVGFLKGELSSSQAYIVTNTSSSFADINNGVITNIPQLNVDLNYKTFFREGELGVDAISGYFNVSSPDAGEIYLALNDKYIILDIEEKNTNFEKENFDVEVYYMGEVPDPLAGVPAPTTLEQMAFQRGGYFANDPGVIPSPLPLGNPETNIGNIEYYFNLFMDEDLPADGLADIGATARDIATNSTRFSFNRDLYATPIPGSPDDGEAC